MAARTTRRVAIGVVIGLFLLANLFVPRLFWWAPPSDVVVYIAFFCAGGLIAEICLAAIWGAMAAQQAKYRIPVSLGMFLLIACSYVLGVQFPSQNNFPLAVAIVFIGMGAAMYATVLLPLWIVRRFTGTQIAVPAEWRARTGEKASTQFGLRYLMMCPVVVSAVIVVIQYSMPHDNSERLPHLVELAQIVFFAALFITFSTLVCIPCLWVALSQKRRLLWGLLLGLVWLGVPWCILVGLESQMGMRNRLEAIQGIMVFGTGVVLTNLFGLFALRFLGYRLIDPGGGGCRFREVERVVGECPFQKDPVGPFHVSDPPAISGPE